VSVAAQPAVASAATVYVTRHADNMISQFHIGAGGALEPLDPAAVNSAIGAQGVVVSPDSESVYAAGISGGTGTHDMVQYDISASGALGAKTPFTVPVVADTGTAGYLAVSPDNASVYVGGYNTTFGGGLYEFDADAAGVLTPKASPNAFRAGGDDPRQVVVQPAGLAAYVADRSNDKIFRYTIGAGGILGTSDTSTLDAATGLAVSPDGKSLYATQNGIANTVAQYDINQTTGALTPKVPAVYTFPDGSGHSIAISPDGLSAYVTNNASQIEELNIDPVTGVLSAKSTPRIALSNSGGIAVAPDGASLYVTTGSGVAQFDIGAGGLLTPKSTPTVAVGGQTTAIAVTSVGSGTGTPPSEPPPVEQPPTDPPAEPPAEPPTEPPATPPTTPPSDDPTLYFKFEGANVTVIAVDKKGVATTRGTCNIAASLQGNLLTCFGATGFYLSKPTHTPGSGNFPPGFPNPGSPRAAKQEKPIAKATFTIPDGQTKKIKLKLTKAGRKALAKAKGGKLKVFQLTAIRTGDDTIASAVTKIKLKRK
jgi:6-phosphogluconolactonase (cycloisomerase 2 family)